MLVLHGNMHKGQRRGILGAPKDPKKLVLFSYNGEAWPSDDSGDSDYQPETVDNPPGIVDNPPVIAPKKAR